MNKATALLVSFVLIAVIGLIDFETGFEIGMSVFYVLPIALVTWRVGRWQGIAASVASACVWLGADMASREVFASPIVPLWNTAIRLTFFVIITMLLAALSRAMQRENELARIDYLTGAANRRFFSYLAQTEIDRCQRYKHPFTVAYIDIDNFKYVNDYFGHAIGDEVLNSVVRLTRNHIRNTDQIARLGGDEFVLLFPETNQVSARSALPKIQEHLNAEMQKRNWPVTFSIGVLTCTAAPPTTDALVAMADQLMYSVKNSGKNSIRYDIYSGPATNQ